ncbi:hypothetical protein PI126_g14700 [Phytophthora idaei]|nr:hypothetical protein PI126_g14700 [Phytophthora idaei]
MPAAPKNQKPFRKRIRLTKQQELEICELHTKIPDATNATLAALARTKLSLARAPPPHVIGRVLKSAMTLRGLSADCLARKKARPKLQLQLNQSVVEFALMCDETSEHPGVFAGRGCAIFKPEAATPELSDCAAS